MERTSSVDILLGPCSLIQTTSNTSVITNNPQQVGLINSTTSTFLALTSTTATITQSLNYLYKIIVFGLIEVFEKHFSTHLSNISHFSTSVIRIFNILVDYLDAQYSHSSIGLSSNTPVPVNNNLPSSLSTIATETLAAAAHNLHSQLLQPQAKYFNYYATIRKEIFEFLLRLRSDNCGKALLMNKIHKLKFQESKYLHLSLRFAIEKN